MNAIRLPLVATSLALGIAALGVVVGVGRANAANTADICAIEANAHGGMVEIAGVLDSDVAMSGSYRFEVVSSGPSGNSNINQGGAFTANPGDNVTLGKVTLGNPGAVYDVRLTVSTAGSDYVCEDRIASR